MHKFWHRDGLGDILYSLLALKQYAAEHGPVELGIARNGIHGFDQLTALRQLVEMQPYIAKFYEQPMKNDTTDLRAMVDSDRIGPPNIVRPYFRDLGLEWLGYAPWLKGPLTYQAEEPYVVLNVTSRYRDENFRWGSVLPAGEIRFIGFPEEYGAFVRDLLSTGYASTADRIDYHATMDLFDVAEQLAGARAFYGNASSCYVLAQGLGVPEINVELTDHTRNTCAFGHETIINKESAPWMTQLSK